MEKISIDTIMFIIYIIIYCTVVSLYNFGNPISNYRYYALFGLCILSIIVFIISKKQNEKKMIAKENLLSIVIAIVFLMISIYKSLSVNMIFSIRTIVQICLFLLPTMYSFYVINFVKKKNIIIMLKALLMILIVTYFFDMQEPLHHISQFFSLNNWLSIDYIHSSSFTESHNWSETFLQLFLFFFFVYNKNEKNISIKICYILSFVFTLLSFKRLGVIFAIIILLFGKRIIKKNQFKKSHHIFITFLFVTLTIAYTALMKGLILDYNTVFDLTSGRNWILKMWEMKGYFSYGYGTSLLVIGKYLELDLVQIYMEIGIISLAIFCYGYFKMCKKNIYSNIIMIYVFFNMLTASSLPWQISWVVMMINITFITYYDVLERGNESEYEKRFD